jgi:hypothetical protein
MKTRFNVWASLSVCLLLILASCTKSYVNDNDMPVPRENPNGDGAAAACACPSGWQCNDLDAGASVRQTGVAIPIYNNEVGYTRFNWPFRVQPNARLTNSFFCWYDKDNRLYFRDAYFANPANAGNIRLRYNNGNPLCTWRTPFADYLTANAGNALGLPAGTQYVRVTIGESCYRSDVLLVGR